MLTEPNDWIPSQAVFLPPAQSRIDEEPMNEFYDVEHQKHREDDCEKRKEFVVVQIKWQNALQSVWHRISLLLGLCVCVYER